mgnify:CR=1 FL=1
MSKPIKSVLNSQRRVIRQIIREEFHQRKVLVEHANLVESKMYRYEQRCRQQGMMQEQINEGLVVILNEGFGDVGFDMIKRYLAGKLLEFLGISKSEDPILFTFFQNVLEAINYSEITKYFGSGSCPALMDMLTEAITETVTEMGGEKVISYLATKFLPSGAANMVTDALDSSLADVSQEAINEVVVALVKGYLQEPMREYVCEGKLMDAVKGLFGAGEGGDGFDFDFDFGSMLGSAFGSLI